MLFWAFGCYETSIVTTVCVFGSCPLDHRCWSLWNSRRTRICVATSTKSLTSSCWLPISTIYGDRKRILLFSVVCCNVVGRLNVIGEVDRPKRREIRVKIICRWSENFRIAHSSSSCTLRRSITIVSVYRLHTKVNIILFTLQFKYKLGLVIKCSIRKIELWVFIYRVLVLRFEPWKFSLLVKFPLT